MIYKYTNENDIPAICSLTLHELPLLRELTAEAVKDSSGGYRYHEINDQLQAAILKLNKQASIHFSWQKNHLEEQAKEETQAKANA